MSNNMDSGGSIQAKILALSLGDTKMEATLACLYYKSLQELKDLYATGLTKKDPKLMGFIRHKYRSTFHMLGLSALEAEVNSGKDKLERAGSEQAMQASAVKVRSLCDNLLAQLRQYYPWLKGASYQAI